MPTFYAGDIATPQIRAWRFVLDEGNYWLLTAMQGALAELSFPHNWVQEGDADPDQAADIATQIIDSLEPTVDMIGVMLPFAGDSSVIPDGTLLCDGTSYLRTDYPDLFAVIGTVYGAADSTHFNVPDMRALVATGAGSSRGLTSHSLGAFYGEETHVLLTAEMPSHSHTDLGHTHIEGSASPTAITIGAGVPAPSAIPTPGVTGSGSANLTNTGGDGAHNNLQPSLAINWVISWRA